MKIKKCLNVKKMLLKNYDIGKNKINASDVIELIPVRFGSKNIKNKNIQMDIN